MAMTYVAAVTFVVGLALFVIPPCGQMPLSCQVALTGLALGLWSLFDGLFGQFRMALALIEAVLSLRLAVGRTRLLNDVLGSDAVDWRPWDRTAPRD